METQGAHTAADTLIYFGGEVKATRLDDGRTEVSGLSVIFDDEHAGGADLMREFFSAKSYLSPALKRGDEDEFEATFNHGIATRPELSELAEHTFANPVKARRTEAGVVASLILEQADEYEAMLADLAQKGRLRWSSGSAGHRVKRVQMPDGRTWLKNWPIVEIALTHTPAEPRTAALPLKSLLSATAADIPTPQPTTIVEEQNTQQTPAPTPAPVAQPEANAPDPIKALTEAVTTLTGNVAEIQKAFVATQTKTVVPEYAVPTPSVNTHTGRGDTYTKAFRHYLRTGDAGGIKAAMQGQTDSEGGYAVPDDFYARVIEKVGELSVPRRAGATVIQTSLDVVKVPTEATRSTFAVIAEEGTYGQSEPTLGQVSITVHKAGFRILISEELLVDEKANLMGFIESQVAKALATYENAAATVGSGTGAWQGVTVGGTAGLTLASTTAVTAAEINNLFYKLKSDYRQNASWTFENATEGAIRALTGNPFYFQQTPAGELEGRILGRPVYVTDEMPSMTAAQKSIVVGDWSRYAIAERQGLSIRQNPYLYQATGQVALFCSVRSGGAVLQAEAFQYATQAAV